MKQITITIPDNCELKQDGNTYTIVEKGKKLTYEDVAEKLFKYSNFWFCDDEGIIETCEDDEDFYLNPNNCISKKQAEKLLAINKLMNVAKYLNDGWQPNWNRNVEKKHCIHLEDGIPKLSIVDYWQSGDIYFKSTELGKKAIEILGEETIKLALCTDY